MSFVGSSSSHSRSSSHTSSHSGETAEGDQNSHLPTTTRSPNSAPAARIGPSIPQDSDTYERSHFAATRTELHDSPRGLTSPRVSLPSSSSRNQAESSSPRHEVSPRGSARVAGLTHTRSVDRPDETMRSHEVSSSLSRQENIAISSNQLSSNDSPSSNFDRTHQASLPSSRDNIPQQSHQTTHISRPQPLRVVSLNTTCGVKLINGEKTIERARFKKTSGRFLRHKDRHRELEDPAFCEAAIKMSESLASQETPAYRYSTSYTPPLKGKTGQLSSELRTARQKMTFFELGIIQTTVSRWWL